MLQVWQRKMALKRTRTARGSAPGTAASRAAEMKSRLDTLSKRRVRAPVDQDYGQREFHVADEGCTLVFFGEAIPRH